MWRRPIACMLLAVCGACKSSGTQSRTGEKGGGRVPPAATNGVDVPSLANAEAPSVGRVPLLFSKEWAANWRRAMEEHHPWADLLFERANATGTSGMHASDSGLYAVMAYRITGNVEYANKAWSKLGSLGEFGEQPLREYLTHMALCYYGLADYWSLPGNDEKRRRFTAWMNKASDVVFSVLDKGLRDSDVVVGALGIFVWALASAEHNDRAHELLTNPRMGELAPKARNLDNVRNAVALYAEHAKGGVWIESRHYNEGTLTLLAMATEGIRALTGIDHFPEITAFYRKAALAEIYSITPDFAETYYWGDEEHAREFRERLWRRVTLLGMLQGLTQADPSSGPYLQRAILDLAAKHGYRGYRSAEPWERFFLLYNPFSKGADLASLPLHHDAPGMGFSLVRESWRPEATGLLIHGNNPPHVDHEVPYASDVHMYRRGEWLLTRPGVWGGHAYSNNTFLLEGLGSAAEWRGRLAAEYADGRYTYVCSGTAGNWAWDGFYNPPATFIHEAVRALWFSPCRSGGCATLVVHDRLNAAPLKDAEKYYEPERKLIEAHTNKKVVFHTPVVPKLEARRASWSTQTGQALALHFLSEGWTVSNVADSAGLVGGTISQESELRQAIVAVPTAERQWDTLLSVFSVADPGVKIAASRLATAGDVEGVRLSRSSNDDVVILFSAKQGPDLPPARIAEGKLVTDEAGVSQRVASARLLARPFSFHVTTSAAADVYLTDLDPTRDWSALVDAHRLALAVSAAGVGHLRLAAAGSHAIEVRP